MLASAAKARLSWADAPKGGQVVWVYAGSFRGVRDQPVTGHEGSIPRACVIFDGDEDVGAKRRHSLA